MKRTLHPLRNVTIAFAVLAAVGCSSLFTQAPRPLFRISAPADVPTNLPHTSAQIVIDAPYAPEGLELRRIAVVRASNGLDYLADGDWADRTPDMVRAVLVEAFENSRAVAAVGPDTLDLRADYEIDGDLRHFEAMYDSPAGSQNGGPTVWVALAVKLVKIPEHKILAQTLVTAREPAAANATPQIVAAFNAAMGSVAKQVVAWTLTNPALSIPRR
jgi:cholesterol transport system auxiliary component